MALPNTVTERISDKDLQRLASAAWAVRENAHVIGPTKVGCAVLCTDGQIYTGCNVEHKYRCHDVHAEVNAITTMVAERGSRGITAVVIAASRERFTPCGGCMDWIMQFALDDSCVIASQSTPDGPLHRYTARQLMPFYPK
jgi:cytidine deaminase